MLMKSMALALAPYKIRVNAVLPFAVPTDQNAKNLNNPKIRRALIKGTPLHILGTPEDVFHAVLYLAAPEARWVTGCTLELDGGWTLT
jgi:NAD(P)-dependent dehydrogenase (short-subunit alcohol dehydrogenase family)